MELDENERMQSDATEMDENERMQSDVTEMDENENERVQDEMNTENERVQLDTENESDKNKRVDESSRGPNVQHTLQRKPSRLASIFGLQPKPNGSLKNITNVTPLSRSTSKLKVRDNVSYLLGWETKASQKSDSQQSDSKQELASKQESGSKQAQEPGKTTTDEFEFLGIPSSRLFFTDPQQQLAFKFSLHNHHARQVVYNFYFKWVVWLETIDVVEDKKKVVEKGTEGKEGKKSWDADRIIETNYDLKDFNKFFKTKSASYSKIHVFRMGIMPRRASRKLHRGQTVEFKVQSLLVYDFVKEVLKVALGDDLYQPRNITIPVVGVTYKHCNEDYSIVSLWLQSDNSSDNSREIFELIETIKSRLSSFLQKVLSSAIIVSNETLESCIVYRSDDCLI